jgi:predicted PurR-regulated permease PerM
MFGIVGILVAIPMAAIFDFLYRDEILPRLEARRNRIDAAEAAARAATGKEKDRSGS